MMPLAWRLTEHRRTHQVRLRYRVIEQHRLDFFCRPSVAPMNEIVRCIGLEPGLCVAIDIGQHRSRHAMPQVRNLFAEWLQLVISLPFGELQ